MYTMQVILNGRYKVKGWWDFGDNNACDIIKYLSDLEDYINENTFDEIQDITYIDKVEKYHIEITDTTSGKIFTFEFEGSIWDNACDTFLQAILN